MTARERNPAFAGGGAADAKLYVRPLPLALADSCAALHARMGLPLAGGPLAFTAVQVIFWDGISKPRQDIMEVSAFQNWAKHENSETRAMAQQWLDHLTAPRRDFVGLNLRWPRVMGILNVTPDSFFDGGRYASTAAAVEAGHAMSSAGADFIDVGGESTRPGAKPVEEAEERARTIPVVETLASKGMRVSIDTRHAETMRVGCLAGAVLINDIAALSLSGSLEAAAETGLPVVLMHSNAEPQTMQQNPQYDEVVLEVFSYLAKRVEAAEAAGIARANIAVDPGIGFAKTASHNAQLLQNLSLFHGLGCPLLLGVSRKSFIAQFSCAEAPNARLPGSLAAALWGASQGAQLLRVHDVAETMQALLVWRTAATGEFLSPRF